MKKSKKKGLNRGTRNEVPIVGTASLNLAEFAFMAEEELEINVPLAVPSGTVGCSLSLVLSLRLVKSVIAQEPSEAVQISIVPVPQSPCSAEALSTEKDEWSALKLGMGKVKILTDYMSARRSKKPCRVEEGSDGGCSVRSGDAEYNYPFDTDSLDADNAKGESEKSTEDLSVRHSFSHETLACANFVGGSVYNNSIINAEDEGWIYFSNRKCDVGCLYAENATASVFAAVFAAKFEEQNFSMEEEKTKLQIS